MSEKIADAEVKRLAAEMSALAARGGARTADEGLAPLTRLLRERGSGGSSHERWCLVRWMPQIAVKREELTDATPRDYFCGPLSVAPFERATGGLGFPGGQIGNVSVFAAETEAAARAERVGSSVDVATPLHELHFSVRVYSYWDGSVMILYDGGELREAQMTAWLFRGWSAEQGEARWKCTVECRPSAAGCRVPRLPLGESSFIEEP